MLQPESQPTPEGWGTRATPTLLDGTINDGKSVSFLCLSADGKYLFFNRLNEDGTDAFYRVSSNILPKAKPASE